MIAARNLLLTIMGTSSLTFITASTAKADWSSTSTTQLVLAVEAAKGVKAASQNFAVSGAGLTAPAALNAAGSASPAAGLAFAPTAGVAFNLNMETKTADTHYRGYR